MLCFKTRRNFKVSMHCRSVLGSAYVSVHYIPVKLEGLHWVKCECCPKILNAVQKQLIYAMLGKNNN